MGRLWIVSALGVAALLAPVGVSAQAVDQEILPVSPPPAPAPVEAGGRGAVPAGNPGSWIETGDYPAAALRMEAEGKVGVRIAIDTQGVPTGCTVTRSSGFAELDEQTCVLLQERARFDPAENDAGERVPGTWSTSVAWVIPEGPAQAPPEGRLVMAIVVEKDGTVSSCEVEVAEGEAFPGIPEECPPEMSFAPLLGADGVAERRRIRSTLEVMHETLPD